MNPRLIRSALIGLAFVSAAGIALASEDCPPLPRHQWKPEADARAATETLGYKATSVNAAHGCYEVMAVNRKGRRYELKFNAADMRLVSRYVSKRERELAAR